MNPENLPFTREQFMGMFAVYNQAIWPIQIVAYVLGIVAVALVFWHGRQSDRLITAILAALWLWLGGVFMWVAMRTIDTGPGPVIFSIAFLLQGAVWLWVGVFREQLRFGPDINRFSVIGGLLTLYALLIYPLLGVVNGHVYPSQPLFGVAPCPTIIFTFGLLLFTVAPVPKYVLIVPLVWSVISGLSAPLNYGVYEDFGLLAAGIVGTALLFWRDRLQVASGAIRPPNMNKRAERLSWS